jgi:hypothetical protein
MEGTMPTKHQRIAVIHDDALQAALERAAPLLAPETRPARIVHELAIRGADALVAERAERTTGLEQIIDWTSRGEPPWDPDVLARVDELAWRRPDEP